MPNKRLEAIAADFRQVGDNSRPRWSRQRVVVAIKEAIRLMSEIDAAIPK